MNYYNEHDPKTAAWLRELVKQKHLPAGEVDERDIQDVKPHELRQFTQCHFFAGIGGWSLALQFAGWPEDRPVWTGSCPCQPFSKGGNGKGVADERHLWPAFKWLIQECHPPEIFGEQVAGKSGYEWLAGVRYDLEESGYSVGVANLCAPCKAAPHPRQRLFWVADSNGELNSGDERSRSGRSREIPTIWESSQIFQEGQGRVDELVTRHFTEKVSSYAAARAILDGIPNRVVGMRGSGNAIVPQVAAEFVKAYCDVQRDRVLGVTFSEEVFWG